MTKIKQLLGISHLSVTQAGLTSLLVAAVGQVVAFIPSLATDKQDLISIGSTAISLGFMVANGIHRLAASNVSTRDVEQGAIAAARAELSKVDLNKLAQEAVAANGVKVIEENARAEVQRVLASLLGQAGQAAVPVAPAPAVAQAAPQAVVESTHDGMVR